jgi:hypothetical protein
MGRITILCELCNSWSTPGIFHFHTSSLSWFTEVIPTFEHYAMKLYRGVEVNLHAILTSALDARFTLCILEIRGWKESRVYST